MHTTVLATLAVRFALLAAPASVLAVAQLRTIPLSLFSKLPQIAQNHRACSTGQLSTFAVVSQIAGCAVRLFTTAQEVSDPLVAAGFALALTLNLVVGAQMYVYWGRTAGQEDAAKVRNEMSLVTAKEVYGREKVEVVVQPQSPLPQHAHERSQSAAYGHKRAHKVD